MVCMSLGLAVVIIYALDNNKYLGRIWANLVIGLFFAIYLSRKILSYAQLSLKLKHIKYILQFSVPLIPYFLSSNILAYFDRIMLNDMVDEHVVGLYSFGYNVGTLLLMVISSTQQAIIPDFYKFLNDKEHNRINNLVGHIFSIIAIGAFFLIIFTDEIVYLLADKEYYAGRSVIPIVVIGFVFYGMFTVYNRYLTYIKKTIFLSLAVVTASLCNVGLNWIFIPKFGYIASAYVTMVSYFLMFFLTWIAARQLYRDDMVPLWKIWRPTIILFISISFFLVFSTFYDGFYFALFLKILSLLVMCFIMFFAQVRSFYGYR